MQKNFWKMFEKKNLRFLINLNVNFIIISIVNISVDISLLKIFHTDSASDIFLFIKLLLHAKILRKYSNLISNLN